MDDLDALCCAMGGETAATVDVTVDVTEFGHQAGTTDGPSVVGPTETQDRPAVLAPVRMNSPQKHRTSHAVLPLLKKGSERNENGLGALVSKKQQEERVAAAKTASTNQKKASSVPPRRVFEDAGQATAVFRSTGGLRIKNPVVSSSQLTTLMESMSCIRIDQLRQRIIQDTVPKRWCTIAVVGELSTPRTTESTGAQYGIWKLTDLNESMMYLYVFGNAYQDYKSSVTPGMLVCVVGGKTRRNADSVNLSIDAYTQLVVLGESRDFGFCKGRTKTGDACRIPVNASRCEFCSYHVGKAYREMSSLRKELQGGSLKTAFAANKSKLKWNVGKFQSNSSASGASREVQREAGRARLQNSAARVGGVNGGGSTTMGSKYLVTCADPVKALSAVREAESKKRLASVAKGTGLLKQAPIPARHLASVVVGERYSNSTVAAKVTVVSTAKGGGNGPKASLFVQPPAVTRMAPAMMVDLDDDVGTSFAASLSSSLPARAQAAAIIKAKRASGEAICQSSAAPAFLAKSLEAHNNKKQKTKGKVLAAKMTEGEGTMKRMVQGMTTATATKPATATGTAVNATALQSLSPQDAPEPGSFAALFGDVIREMEETHGSEGKVESKYKDAVEGEDHANLLRRLDVLEKKDNMAQKMESTMHIQVKAFRCEACGSLTERNPERCQKEHPRSVTRIDAVKRWWSCSDCKKGFSTVGVSYPRGSCEKCGSRTATFEKRGMHNPGLDSAQRFAEAQGNAGVASREGILVRGTEHGKFMFR